ncbi:MAG: hypothetical protein E7588_07245 [Ruminococcaceae bacterium]|nr:hypothetical protein [Oscillospiraceae bacterium]
MTVLYIIAGVVAFIAAVLLLNVHLIFAYDDRIKVRVRVLFVSVDVLKFFDKDKKASKKSEKTPAHPTEKKKKTKGSFDDFMAFLELINSVVRMFCDNLSRSLSVKIRRLNAVIATDSPDKTARRYSAVSNAVAVLFELLPNAVRKFDPHYKEIHIYPDYLAEKSTFAAEIVFTMKIWHFIRILFGALRIFNENTRKRISERNRKKA